MTCAHARSAVCPWHTLFEHRQVTFQARVDKQTQIANEFLHVTIASLVHLRHIDLGGQKVGDVGHQGPKHALKFQGILGCFGMLGKPVPNVRGRAEGHCKSVNHRVAWHAGCAHNHDEDGLHTQFFFCCNWNPPPLFMIDGFEKVKKQLFSICHWNAPPVCIQCYKDPKQKSERDENLSSATSARHCKATF